jgi:hypothetical protein
LHAIQGLTRHPQAHDQAKQRWVTQLLGRQEFNECTDSKVRSNAVMLLRHALLRALAAEFLHQ